MRALAFIFLALFTLSASAQIRRSGQYVYEYPETNRLPAGWTILVVDPNSANTNGTQRINASNLVVTLIEAADFLGILTNASTRYVIEQTGFATNLSLYQPTLNFTNGTVIDTETRYISPSGSDSASGFRSAPMLTGDAAVQRLGGRGTVVMLPGFHRTSFNFASVTNELAIVFESGATNMLGTNYAQSTWTTIGGGVYRIAYATNDWLFVNGTDTPFIGELGTNYGEITKANHHPAQHHAPYRMQGFARLTNISAVASLTAGSFAVSNDHIYFKLNSGGTPFTGTSIILPSRTNSFIYGGTQKARARVIGGTILGGLNGVDASGMGGTVIEDSILALNYVGGFLANPAEGPIQNKATAAIANGNDGYAYTTANSTNRYLIEEIDCWSTDNGDEGTSGHDSVIVHAYGCLYENNRNGGATYVRGAHLIANNCHFRDNAYGVIAAISPETAGSTWTNRVTKCSISNSRIYRNVVGVTTSEGTNLVIELTSVTFTNNTLQSVRDNSSPLQIITATACTFDTNSWLGGPMDVEGPLWYVRSGTLDTAYLGNTNLAIIGGVQLGAALIFNGSGNPNGSESRGSTGSMFINTNGIGTNTVYIKTNSTTGWRVIF